MKCYIENCKRQVVGSQGGLLTHYFLCRKHFDREKLDEQLEKEDEEEEDDDEEGLGSLHVILILAGVVVAFYWVLGFVPLGLTHETKAIVAFFAAMFSINYIVDYIERWMEKLKAKKKKRQG